MITAQTITRRSVLVSAVAASATAAASSPGPADAQAAHKPPGVTYVIKFDVRHGKRDQFLALLSSVLDQMRHETTFRHAILHRDLRSDHSFMLYETWESHEDVLNVQLKRPYREAWHAALPELLHAERDISMWEPISTFGATPASK